MRARYRAERRFRFYGLAAIGVTAMFLVVVLTDIVIKGLPAFTQHRLNLEVTVDPAEIDPQGKRDPGDHPRRRLSGACPQCVARAIPRGDRSRRPPAARRHPVVRRSPTILRERVVADPALIGQTVKVPVLLSDDADLYFKGHRNEDRAARRARHRDPERHHGRNRRSRPPATTSRPISIAQADRCRCAPAPSAAKAERLRQAFAVEAAAKRRSWKVAGRGTRGNNAGLARR